MIKKSKQHPNRDIHDNSSYIQMIFSQASKVQRWSKPTTTRKVHLIISGSHFIWVQHEIHIGIYWSSPSYWIRLHIAIAELNWNLMTILYSKIAKVKLIDICIHTLLRTWLVHIVIYCDHSRKIKWFKCLYGATVASILDMI